MVRENLFVLSKNESSGKSVDSFILGLLVVETNKAFFNTSTQISRTVRFFSWAIHRGWTMGRTVELYKYFNLWKQTKTKCNLAITT